MTRKSGAYYTCSYDPCCNPVYVKQHDFGKSRYCSKGCTDLAKIGSGKKSGIYKKCPQCDNPVYHKPYEKDKNKHCSKKCQTKTFSETPKLRKGINFNCIQCGEQFYLKPSHVGSNKGCCSPKCANLAKTGMPLLKRKTGKDTNCLQCGKVFYIKFSEIGKHKFCSRKCANLAKTIHFDGPPKKDIKGQPYKKWRDEILLRDGYACVKCGSIERLEADHIIPWCASVELRYELSNGQTLCRPCHKETPTYGGRAKKYKDARP